MYYSIHFYTKSKYQEMRAVDVFKITRPILKFDQPLTTDYSNQFANFLAEHGLEPDPKKGLVADGSIGRAYINVGGQRKLVGWYQLWLDQASPFGRLGDYRVSADQPTAVWKPENRKRQVMTKAEKAEIAKLQNKPRLNNKRNTRKLPRKLKLYGRVPYLVKNTLT